MISTAKKWSRAVTYCSGILLMDNSKRSIIDNPPEMVITRTSRTIMKSIRKKTLFFTSSFLLHCAGMTGIVCRLYRKAAREAIISFPSALAFKVKVLGVIIRKVIYCRVFCKVSMLWFLISYYYKVIGFVSSGCPLRAAAGYSLNRYFQISSVRSVFTVKSWSVVASPMLYQAQCAFVTSGN